MTLPNRHSLLWKLIAALALLGLLAVSLHVDLTKRLNDATGRLSEPARQTLGDYARQAEAAWRSQGARGLDTFLADLSLREQIWAVVVNERNHSLASHPVPQEYRGRLRFSRPLDGSLGRPGGRPTFAVPFSDDQARLVLELPARFNPRKHRDLWDVALQRLLPLSLALLLGVLLYRSLIAPLVMLRRQAVAMGAGDLQARVGPQVATRRDELGELARAVNHMAGRLENTVVLQRQLLRALSHELRTPLSRLRAAGEREPDIDALRQRQEREVQLMERLIGDTLELVWLDTEELWHLLRDDACYEAHWPLARMPSELPAGCCVQGNLNGLAQALENIVRNAVRHSPPEGLVRLGGQRDGDHWHLWIEDQGPGIAPDQLEQVFQPFTRLGASRPGGEGFGLGLSIARSVVALHGGCIWAQNRAPGLRVSIRLPSV
ncbi:histidine kinase sensor domain-containing protein [Pseudomonas putida]